MSSAVYHQPNSGEFRHELFGCCGNVTDSLLAFLCPPCYSYCTAQDSGEGTIYALLNCLLYPWCLCCLRSRIREKRGIEGGCLRDLCVTYFCPCCAAVQMRREFTD